MTSPGFRFRGRLARAGRPLLIGAAALAVSLSGLALSGCIGGGEPLPVAPPSALVEADTDRLDRLAEAVAKATTDAERDAVLSGALRSAGVAPVADGSVPGGVGSYRFGGVLAGWIVGRHPVQRDSLLLVHAPRDGRSEVALIEAARLLVARSAYTQTPERTVLLVIGDDPASALRLWNRQLVVGSVQVGDGLKTGIDANTVTVPLSEPDDLAPRLFRAIVGAANPPHSIYSPAEALDE